MNAIEIKKLSKSFKERKVVNELSFSVESGSVFGLLGQNGAGKTTTIKMLCGLLRPSSGEVFVEGKSVTDETEEVKKLISLSPQETAAAKKLTVRENLELVAEIYGAGKKEAAERAEEMMKVFSLSERSKDRAGTLSGGTARRLSIAMALINRPRVLFLDEPTLGLDVRARRRLWEQIEKLKGKMTVVLTTHYLEEAQALCDKIAIFGNGSLRAIGTAKEICEKSGFEKFEDAFLFYTEKEV